MFEQNTCTAALLNLIILYTGIHKYVDATTNTKMEFLER